MIYETCVLLRPEATEETATKIKEMAADIVTNAGGEILVSEDWGVRSLAQPTSKGVDRGRYYYVMYQADGTINDEVERRLRINEDVIKFIFVKLGLDKKKEEIVKSYSNPFGGSEEEHRSQRDVEKERRMFAKRKSCWFSANKTHANWRDPSTYSWLVNEFGKISPARVSNITSKHQTFATKAIKRARCIGLIAYTSNRLAR